MLLPFAMDAGLYIGLLLVYCHHSSPSINWLLSKQGTVNCVDEWAYQGHIRPCPIDLGSACSIVIYVLILARFASRFTRAADVRRTLAWCTRYRQTRRNILAFRQ